MVVEQIIRQKRFYLDFKSFTYRNVFNRINQISRKKEKAGEELVGSKKVQEVGSTNLVS